MTQNADKHRATVIVFFILFILVCLWALAAQQNWINGQLLGSPYGIYKSAVIGLTQGTLVYDTWITFYETIMGLIIGSGLGIILGLGLWFYPKFSQVGEQFSVILNSIPKIALGPMIIIWFGSDTTSKIWLSAISSFAVAMISACAVAREIDTDLMNLFRSFKASNRQIFKKLIIPSSVPWIFSIIRINVGFSLIGAVVGEYISSNNGLGHEIFVAGSLFDLNTVWLGVIVLTVMASLVTWCIQCIENKVVKWKA